MNLFYFNNVFFYKMIISFMPFFMIILILDLIFMKNKMLFNYFKNINEIWLNILKNTGSDSNVLNLSIFSLKNLMFIFLMLNMFSFFLFNIMYSNDFFLFFYINISMMLPFLLLQMFKMFFMILTENIKNDMLLVFIMLFCMLELLTQIMRYFSLTLRIVANSSAGHILMNLIMGIFNMFLNYTFMNNSLFLLYYILLIIFIMLEFCMTLLQIYVLATLLMYYSMEWE